MKIGLLTYEKPHRKTQDILFRLLAVGYKDIVIIPYPWENRKIHTPLFPHRPTECIDILPEDLAINLGIEVLPINHYRELSKFDDWIDFFIIGGAGIIGYIPEKPIINVHPGIIPKARGLDALKWSIYKGVDTGITVHQINEKIDSGKIIYSEIIHPMPGEEFYHFAMRIYEHEINALVKYFTKTGSNVETSIYEKIISTTTKRMSHAEELKCMAMYRSQTTI